MFRNFMFSRWRGIFSWNPNLVQYEYKRDRIQEGSRRHTKNSICPKQFGIIRIRHLQMVFSQCYVNWYGEHTIQRSRYLVLLTSFFVFYFDRKSTNSQYALPRSHATVNLWSEFWPRVTLFWQYFMKILKYFAYIFGKISYTKCLFHQFSLNREVVIWTQISSPRFVHHHSIWFS